jgi:bacillopeptidase F (M6 metalloprotease family)
MSLLAGAQPKKPALTTAPLKKPPVKPARPDADDAGAMPRDERTVTKDAGATETKTLDGGTRVFRFGEVEVEGRLKSPQIVYFLRRVRAEFAAGDLGHRSFVHELSETRNEPGF